MTGQLCSCTKEMIEMIKAKDKEGIRWLFLLAIIFAVALLFRLINLGEAPLTNPEAQHALCALGTEELGCEQVSRLYLFFTRILFTLFGSTNAGARFLPALAGSVLTVLPLLLTDILEKRTAIFLAVVLALDPILIQVSRMADSIMIALVVCTLLLLFILKRKRLAAVITALFGLLCGPNFWIGLLIFGAAGFLAAILNKEQGNAEKWGFGALFKDIKNEMTLEKFVFFSLVWLMVATYFFTDIQGIFYPPLSIAAFITQPWFTSSFGNFSPLIKGLGFLYYTIFGIVMSVAALVLGLVHSKRERNFLLIWMVFALLLLLLPGTDLRYAVWLLLPLWVLAAKALKHLSHKIYEARDEIGIPVIIGVIILIYLFLQVVRIGYLSAVGVNLVRNILLLIVPILIGVVLLLMYAFGWSGKAARLVVVGLFIIGGFTGLLQKANRASNLTHTLEYEMVNRVGYLHNAHILLEEVEDYRVQQGRLPGELDIALAFNEPVHNLRWLLRAYEVQVLPTDLLSEISDHDVVMSEEPLLLGSDQYYGQVFPMYGQVGIFKDDLSGFLPGPILEWVLYRTSDLEFQEASLWFKF